MWRFAWVLLLVTCCLADDLNLKDNWEKFKLKYNKKYKSKSHEEESRIRFEKNVKKILKHNMDVDLGARKNRMGVNLFADMSQEEIDSKFRGSKMSLNLTKNYEPQKLKMQSGSSKAAWDWRQQGVVTPVKYMDTCAACWAFAAVAAVESVLAINTGNLLDLSEQQIVDCVGEFGSETCIKGGYEEHALQYITKNGVTSENCIPYLAKKNECSVKSDCEVHKISGYYDIDSDEETVKQKLYEHGPIITAIYSSVPEFENNKGDMYFNYDCSDKHDHVVVLVGYGTENGQDYWILKNSWSEYWGDKGFGKVARNVQGLCPFFKELKYLYI